jgi:ribonuclease PH
MNRNDGRAPNEMREVSIQPDFFRKNDALIAYGQTKVYCYASIEERVPPWLVGAGVGWVTAEYNMMPGSSEPRQQRERSSIGGRTHEIQRLISRSLRAAIRMEFLPTMTLRVDCDVIVADGGTRTACITGGMVALCNLLHQERGRFRNPLVQCLAAAVSAGIYKGIPVLDLNYVEDRDAEVDGNFIGLSTGGFAEVQATNEHGTFDRGQLDALLDLASLALQSLYNTQRKAIKLEF